jgi:hypothetical protein
MTPNIRKAVAGLLSRKNSPDPTIFVWFDLSDAVLSDLDSNSAAEYLTNSIFNKTLPFDRVAFVFGSAFYIIATDPEVHGKAAMIAKDGAGFRTNLRTAYINSGAKGELLPDLLESDHMRMAKALWCISNCTSSGSEVNGHRAAFKKGVSTKRKLFDWVTVPIKQHRQHTSQARAKRDIKHRLHEVRGHWCVRKSTGKRYWRKAHKRGDVSLGVVFHDYTVKP